MTDRAQFEAMLEALINDDQQAAKEIFHNIVVGKSREIYEELLESDFSSQDTGNPYAGQTEGSEEEEEESMEEEGAEEEGAEEEEEEEEEEPADDAEDDSEESDDAEDDGEEDPFASDEEGEDDGAIEDRVMDLEDALEDLKAEFEQLMAGEEAEEHDHPGIHDMGGDDTDMAMGGDDMTGQEGDIDELAGLMEYVNKIGVPYQSGSNIAGSTEGQGVGVQAGSVTGKTNTKSIVAGKNDMGGTTANIAQAHVEVQGDAGKKAGGTKGGLASPDTKPLVGKVMNTPGGDAGKTAFKTQVKGGGIDRQSGFNKEGPQVGTGAGDKGTKNTTSVIGKRVR
jgi:hypothetical protein